MTRTDLVRMLERYAVPNFLRSLFYSARFACLISLRADVQLTSCIRLGRGTNIRPYARLITTAGSITLGRHCGINSFTMIAAGNAPITIGDHVNIGPSTTIIASNYGSEDPRLPMMYQPKIEKGIVIEDDVLIGASVVVLDGVRIGRGSIVGGGAVVTKDVPPMSIAVGNPARVIGTRGKMVTRLREETLPV
ncbi:MAG: acyltransferase [Elusimicrobia bacterium]|nr:acyltransferase [Elusimicrobiota bacterium]